MTNIRRLRSQIDAARIELSASRDLDGGPRELADELAANSLRFHIDQLETELKRALERRSVEVLDLHLDGEGLRDGSIPLKLLAQVGERVANAIQAGVQRRKTGKRVLRLSPRTADLLDLRLAGITSGSTRLQVTGATAPDLFGESDLEQVLESTFHLLSEYRGGDLVENVSSLGVRAAREIRRLADLLAERAASLEFVWFTPTDQERKWSASTADLKELSAALGQYEEREPEELEVSGSVVTLSARGRFELDVGGRILGGTFPSDLQKGIRQLRIGQGVKATIRRTTVVNTVTARERVENVLTSIAASGQEESGIGEDDHTGNGGAEGATNGR